MPNKYILHLPLGCCLVLRRGLVVVADLVVDNEPHLRMLPICIDEKKNPKT